MSQKLSNILAIRELQVNQPEIPSHSIQSGYYQENKTGLGEVVHALNPSSQQRRRISVSSKAAWSI